MNRLSPSEKAARIVPPSVPPEQRMAVLAQVMQKIHDLNITATLEDDDDES